MCVCVDSSSEMEELLFEGSAAHAVNDLTEAGSANRVKIEQRRRFRAQ